MHLIDRILFALACFALGISRGSAAEVTDIPEIGAHQPIVIIQKNVNPQNRMIVYTRLDEEGRFQRDPGHRNQPVFDFYWLMEGKSYKPVNGLIKNEIRKRFECELSPKDQASRFIIHMNDLKEVKTDIAEPKMEVYIRGSGDERDVEAEMTLGPSDGNKRIKLLSIYTEGRAFPPSVQAVTLQGEEIVKGKPTGKKVTRRYAAGE